MILAPADEIAESFGSAAAEDYVVLRAAVRGVGLHREFEALPYATDAVAVRRWDDQAKDPSGDVPGLGHYRPLLERLVVS
jgi:predicted HD phosphohydrolase